MARLRGREAGRAARCSPRALDAAPDERDDLLAYARASRVIERRASARTNDRPCAAASARAAAAATTTRARRSPSARRPGRAARPAGAAHDDDRLVPADRRRSATPAHGIARGELDDAGYEAFLERQIAEVVREQEELGLDVLVHGEPERNDMVEYFGEQLAGFAFRAHGWVQSYGRRCVKPPILFGDVSRPAPMTVRWWEYAQSLTEKPMKGMLTGPVTILQWSFVRDDQPRARDLHADRARHRRRGRRPRGGRRRVDPDRRARPARGPAAARERPGRLPALGGRRVPAHGARAPGRDPDPHAHVLLGVQRDHRAHRAPGRRRHLDRDVALGHGAARGVPRLRLPERDRPRRLRHPLAARAAGRGDRAPARARRGADRRASGCG